MKTVLILAAATAALALAPAAFAQDASTTTVEHSDGSVTTKTAEKDHGGTAPGAVGGAVAGAVVAGPIGAVVGGIAGATVGHTVAPPKEVRTYVTTQDAPPVAYNGRIEQGKRIDGDVAWRDVDGYPKYHWQRFNDERVVVDENHNVVAIYTN